MPVEGEGERTCFWHRGKFVVLRMNVCADSAALLWHSAAGGDGGVVRGECPGRLQPRATDDHGRRQDNRVGIPRIQRSVAFRHSYFKAKFSNFVEAS